jgi:hypothetical protein
MEWPEVLKLHRDLAKIASGADRIFQLEAENCHNVSVTILRRAEGGFGGLATACLTTGKR